MATTRVKFLTSVMAPIDKTTDALYDETNDAEHEHPYYRSNSYAEGDVADVESTLASAWITAGVCVQYATPLIAAEPVTLVNIPAVMTKQMTDLMVAAGEDVAPQYTFVSGMGAAVDRSVVEAQAGKRIKVLAWTQSAGAAISNLTYNSKGAGAGTAISATYYSAINSSACIQFCPVGYFQTNVGEALTVTTVGTGPMTIQVVYIVV